MHSEPKAVALDLLDYLDDQLGSTKDAWLAVLQQTVDRLSLAFDHFDWTGIYLVEGADLVLGPFVGAPTEHLRIPIGAGICGAAAAAGETIVVDDVRADERYLACFLSTKSEIVVPIIAGTRVIGEIDIDSDQPAAFGPGDRAYLERVAERLGRLALTSMATEAAHASARDDLAPAAQAVPR